MNMLMLGGRVRSRLMGRSYTQTMRGMPTVVEAEGLARELLSPLANRWAHVQAVAASCGRAHPCDCRRR